MPESRLTRLAMLPDMLEIMTMLPGLFFAWSTRAAYLQVLNTPVTLTPSMRLKSSAG